MTKPATTSNKSRRHYTPEFREEALKLAERSALLLPLQRVNFDCTNLSVSIPAKRPINSRESLALQLPLLARSGQIKRPVRSVMSEKRKFIIALTVGKALTNTLVY